MTILRQRTIEDLRIRNHSPRTIDAYVERVARFAQHFGKAPDRMGASEVRQFQLFLVETRKVCWAALDQTVFALRFFYRVRLGKTWMIEHIPFPKQKKKLPVVLSRAEDSLPIERVGSLPAKISFCRSEFSVASSRRNIWHSCARPFAKTSSSSKLDSSAWPTPTHEKPCLFPALRIQSYSLGGNRTN